MHTEIHKKSVKELRGGNIDIIELAMSLWLLNLGNGYNGVH